MLALLFVAAAAHAVPLPGKIIPVFELADQQQRIALEDVGHQLRSPCLTDCHHHILDQPVYIIAQPEANGHYAVHYTPEGLNSLGRSPSTSSFNQLLAAEQPVVTLIAPLGKFPFEIFPGILDQDVHVPAHSAKLIDMYRYKDAPVVAIIPEVDFKKIADQKAFTQVADLMLQDNVYHVAKEYALVHRLAPIQQQLIQQQQPIQQQEYVQFAPNPIYDLHQVKFIPIQPIQQVIPPHQIHQIHQIPLIHPQNIF